MTTTQTIKRDLIDHMNRLSAAPRSSLFNPDPENTRGKIMRAAAARFVAMSESLSPVQREKLAADLYASAFTAMSQAGEEGEEQYRALTPHEIAEREIFDERMIRRLADAITA